MNQVTGDNKPIKLVGILKEEYKQIFSINDKNTEEQKAPCDDSTDSLPRFFSKLHKSGNLPIALCLSGGGIRSATFALGVLQGLAEKGKLDKFHYLSTVSGGGYIGSWLTAWIHHSIKESPSAEKTEAVKQVVEGLKKNQDSFSEKEKTPVDHLRTFSNYLTPKLGLLSADTWTLITTYLRNLSLNWLVIIPLMLAVLMLPRIYVSLLTFLSDLPDNTVYPDILLILGVVAAAFGVGYIGANLPENQNTKEGKTKTQSSFLKWCLSPFLISIILISAWLASINNKEISIWVFPFIAFIANSVGILSYFFTRKSKQDLKDLENIPNEGKFWQTLKRILLITAVFGVSITGGFLAWLIATKDTFNFSCNKLAYSCITVPLIFLLFSVAGTLYVGVTSNKRNGDQDREWWARCGAWGLIAMVSWVTIHILVIYGPLVFLYGESHIYPALVAAVGSSSGLTALLGGFSSKTSPKTEASKQSPNLQLLIKVATSVFLIVIAISLSLLTTFILLNLSIELDRTDVSSVEACINPTKGLLLENHKEVIEKTNIWLVMSVFSGCILIGVIMSRLINPNKFSLNAAYGNRLIRAYLGASRPKNTRKPNLFTGFDYKDDIKMCDLWKKDKQDTSPTRLFHVVNTTLNLIGGSNLAWQERKAESFTITPLHCGSSRHSYRSSEKYGEGITLGTAVAISGAAASPNMGYNSSPTVTLLMTLFNIRMGWWLGNPSYNGNTWERSGPVFSLGPFVREALGQTNDTGPYVYLSDGGHFENLGLYEMVLRRCEFILISDASCDPEYKFEDLANAIRKIRIDLGIDIEFMDTLDFMGKDKGKKGQYFAIADIKYSKVDDKAKDGKLIYIKPCVFGSEPVDVCNYKKLNPDFPHETTADQFFSESQFESYRILGYHIIKNIIEETKNYPDLNW